VVPHTGFEPVISALRGRCPGPLDECGTAFERTGGMIPRRRTTFNRRYIGRFGARQPPRARFQ
jgi:hypothetical protein